MTRQQKTERQRAEEALEVARRKVARLRDAETRLEHDLKDVKNQRLEAERLFTYRAEHPALPTGNRRVDHGASTTTPKETTTP